MPRWTILKTEVRDVWISPGKVEKEYRVEAISSELKTQALFRLPHSDEHLKALVKALG